MASPNRRQFLKDSSLLVGALGLASLPATATTPEKEPNNLNFVRKTINLWPDKSPNNQVHEKFGRPRLELYIPEGAAAQKRAAIVVCPGGGYRNLAAHEGQPLAELFAAQGIVGAVLTYHISPEKHTLPYADACRAIRLLRNQAAELNIDATRVGIMGFSAGGHLAATVATQPELFKDPQDNLAGKVSARPDRVILGYPVISFQEFAHKGSAEALLGKNVDEKLLQQFSNDQQVTAQNPPAFLFHTADDAGVPVENSLRFAAACSKNKVPFALHVYPHGRHGVGMALDNPALKSWTTLLVDWLAEWSQPQKG
ncbi:MAG: alpha/beta hydrolase [Adhaeribacter sp.]